MTISRPDITYAVNRLGQFMSKPRTADLQAVHFILQYLKGTFGQGLLFSTKFAPHPQAYVDADWGTCVDSHKSISRHTAFFGDSLISRKS